MIAGLVSESDELDESGPGFQVPLFPTSRSSQVSNSELVFLLKPRVIVYTSEDVREAERKASIATASAKTTKPKTSYSVKDTTENNFPRGSIGLDSLNPKSK